MITKHLVRLAVLAALFGVPCAVLGQNNALSQTRQHYLIDAAFENGGFMLKGVTLMQGDALLSAQGDWHYDVVSNNEEILDRQNFDAPKGFCPAGGVAACVPKSSFVFSLAIPYFETAANINIYDQSGKMVLFAQVAEFARLCGDGVCQANENYGSCANDCKSGAKDGYCDSAKDGICDPDCAKDKDRDCAPITPGGVIGQIILWIAGIIAVLAIVAVLVFIRRKNNAPGGAQQEEIE